MAREHPQARRISAVGSLVLFTAGLSFTLRAAVIGELEARHLAPLDPAGSATRAGQLLGVAFLGFALTLGLCSVFLGSIGMGRGLRLAAGCFALGTGVTVLAPELAAGESLYAALWTGFLLSGLGWGFMEATVNPLAGALYPDERVRRLNALHAWWPAGQIAGGLASLALAALGLGWRATLALVALPALASLWLSAGLAFPRSERVDAGVSTGEMLRELLRQPGFLVFWLCMLLTAAAELAPGQWIDLTLTRTVGMRGIWLVIYVAGMMFALRHFAGPIAARFSALAMLWASSALAALGLVLLARADSPLSGLVAATVWGLGVCFLWPTMLANVAQRYPRGGEFFIGLMGVAGALSIQFVLPWLGAVFDRAKQEIAGGQAAFAQLAGEAREAVLRDAAATSFETLALLPAILVFVFGAAFWLDRWRAQGRFG